MYSLVRSLTTTQKNGFQSVFNYIKYLISHLSERKSANYTEKSNTRYSDEHYINLQCNTYIYMYIYIYIYIYI